MDMNKNTEKTFTLVLISSKLNHKTKRNISEKSNKTY